MFICVYLWFNLYPVKVIDSAGAGDSFRSGVVYGMLNGWSGAQAIRYASAPAGMICATFPGVLRFIRRNARPGDDLSTGWDASTPPGRRDSAARAGQPV